MVPMQEAVGAAHNKKIAHMDNHYENIIINKDGKANLIDFGLAQKLKTMKTENPQLEYLIDDFILATNTYKLAQENKRGRGDPLLVGAKMEYDKAYQKLNDAFRNASPEKADQFAYIAKHHVKRTEAIMEKPAQLPDSMIRNEPE
ncbi:hypothetical protein O9G_002948 [Rozella allomycis CSF55]|uniref:Protein kinase domain-containing protein n=1 Tax=Rozella allomycis (strain CSF55) TaxID=988480 RepID=A0A075ANN4_ROZAC|nr:hypothetical protein O9G_002948 [Rozella allomycis CSF55]|eukprot:EPZ31479.1 hypothetical protein O9G_002948 [Rozella allomycis CSF55]